MMLHSYIRIRNSYIYPTNRSDPIIQIHRDVGNSDAAETAELLDEALATAKFSSTISMLGVELSELEIICVRLAGSVPSDLLVTKLHREHQRCVPQP